MKRREARQWHEAVTEETTTPYQDAWDTYDQHVYESERCVFCNSNVYDNMIYGDDGCIPNRAPMAYSTSTANERVTMSTRAMYDGFMVTETIEGAQLKMPDYPLLEEDLLVKNSLGTYDKVCPGLEVLGFQLTPEQEATLTPVKYYCWGLDYHIYTEDEVRVLEDAETAEAVELASQSTESLTRRNLPEGA
jgi:hypothetical protein